MAGLLIWVGNCTIKSKPIKLEQYSLLFQVDKQLSECIPSNLQNHVYNYFIVNVAETLIDLERAKFHR